MPADFPPRPDAQSVAIIGGGFSGIMTAVNLARLSRQPVDITIINQHRTTGRGVAYGTRRPEHLLNVAARNMSAFPDLPDHFLQWLRTRSEFEAAPEHELRERFIPRMIYGDYLRGLSQHHLQTPSSSVPLGTRFVEDEAMDIEVERDRATIRLASGGTVKADRVVLASGNETPAELPGSAELRDHPAWVANPWGAWEQRLPAGGGTLIVLGTGLTTVDAVLTVRAVGWPGQIHSVSRNGWLPQAHFRGIEYPDFPPAGVDLAEFGLPALLALVETHCARLLAANANPAIIVDKLRPHTQRIWRHFSVEERREFVQSHAARWSILRHRIAPEIHAVLSTAQLNGQLKVQAGNIDCLRADGDRLCVYLKNGAVLTGDLVINATGPATKLAQTSSPLLQNLLRRGLIAPDAMEMGVKVSGDHVVVDREGNVSSTLLVLGPLLRGTLWETIAVPELRGQARRVAEQLLDQHAAVTGELPVMMEYMI